MENRALETERRREPWKGPSVERCSAGRRVGGETRGKTRGETRQREDLTKKDLPRRKVRHIENPTRKEEMRQKTTVTTTPTEYQN